MSTPKNPMWLSQTEFRWVAGILAAGLLLRGAIAVWLPPGFDEAYYYQYTRYLDWSYFDHPVLVALTTGFGCWLTGNVSAFTIRLGSLLLYTGSLLLLYLTSRRLFSVTAARLTLAIASIIPIFMVGFGVLTLPDSPLMFFWTAALYVAVLEFFGQPESYQPSYRLAIVGLFVGLACLGKYHGVVLGASFVGFCLTSSRYRSALVSPWMLVGLGLFLLAIAPIVIWNVQHDWISLRFQSSRAVPDRGYSVLDLAVTFLVGIAYLFPTFGVPLWWVSGRTIAQQPKSVHNTELLAEKQRLILWISLPLMVGFTVMGGYRPILPTWAMPGFWGATLLLGQYSANWQARSRRSVQRWVWGSGIVIVTLITIALLHLNLGTLQQGSRYAWFGGMISADADGSAQLLDIQQLRHELAMSEPFRAALEQSTFLFTDEIFLAGQVGMAVAPLTDKPITSFDQDQRGYVIWTNSADWVGANGLYFSSQRRYPSRFDRYPSYFQSIQPIAEIPIQRGGAIVDVMQVYFCQTLLKPYQASDL
ncbi:glycosyltransferase family 39 protein [Pantanalinema rosaneae CENA516]|uniref:ArnT family glycosyltransferase n=1 Tax=Pantanalinema rosaneae TaxID=1620701 RepID=UPI003D6EC78D